jgi:hypothetical protein
MEENQTSKASLFSVAKTILDKVAEIEGILGTDKAAMELLELRAPSRIAEDLNKTITTEDKDAINAKDELVNLKNKLNNSKNNVNSIQFKLDALYGVDTKYVQYNELKNKYSKSKIVLEKTEVKSIIFLTTFLDFRFDCTKKLLQNSFTLK